ncbi:hypothetical protein PGTUg99_005088 [Puccinia graminis f. sp. tritici]|uniref:Uncharacterized protein n=1 Tax=Puccinia graminis f. sp. tritici TaxID=56615 RepID=A0A5B0RBB7_PUCGR|nr:hypothetical protein PGTUg99_005088 [Puccinia graminis f. sp. tritici]
MAVVDCSTTCRIPLIYKVFYNVFLSFDPTLPSISLSHHTSAGIPQKDTDSVLLDECMSRPLSPKLWMEMGMNEFLRDYRNGENLNLLVLAISFKFILNCCWKKTPFKS